MTKSQPQKQPVKRPFSQDCSGPSPVQQHFKDSCNVNNIVAHFAQTGVDPYAERKSAEQFGYASSQSFAEALRNVAECESAFAELSAKERSAHSNSVGRWLDHLNTPPDPVTEITPPPPAEEVSPTVETPVPPLPNEGD